MQVTNPRQLLAAIADLPSSAPVRILTLSSDHERLIHLAGLRRLLSGRLSLLSGPGCVASACPEADLYQAIQLAMRHELTLFAPAALFDLALPLPAEPGNLRQAAGRGGDVRLVADPMEAVVAARAYPQREMVLFLAGFETLLAPLAGMILQGLPPNLSLLLCGRRVEPLLEAQLQARGGAWFDAMLLPGNRCAVTGFDEWSRLSAAYRLPAVISGYTLSGLLGALLALLQQCRRGEARVENQYLALVRPGGNAGARDALDRVFERVEGTWRGLGSAAASALRLRHAYATVDADRRFPDYRAELGRAEGAMPPGCDCAEVFIGREEPFQCAQYQLACRLSAPYGPCMASRDGNCHMRSAGAAA